MGLQGLHAATELRGMIGFVSPWIRLGGWRSVASACVSSRIRMCSEFGRLQGVVEQLGRNCPWVANQTAVSLVHHIKEELSEVLDSLEADEAIDDVQTELGDVVFNVLLLAEVLRRDKAVNLAEGITATTEKVIRRSPHVFGDDHAATVDEAQALWQREKQKEKTKTLPSPPTPPSSPPFSKS